MTITTYDRRLEYPGNDVATVFDGPRAFSTDDLSAYLTDDETEEVTNLELGVDYEVDGLRLANTVFTLTGAVPTGKTLTLLRTLTYTNATRFTNQGAFFAALHEDEFDRTAMRDQQLADLIGLLTERVDDIIVTGATSEYDLRYLRLIGGVLCGDGLDALTDGIDVTPTNEGLDFTPRTANRIISLHPDSPSSDGGGVVAGRFLGRIPLKTLATGGLDLTARGGDDFNGTASGSWASCLATLTDADPIDVTIQDNNGDTEDWKEGDYFSICQGGAGQVTVTVENGTLRKPSTVLAKTAEQYAVTHYVCIDPTPGASIWLQTGDAEVA